MNLAEQVGRLRLQVTDNAWVAGNQARAPRTSGADGAGSALFTPPGYTDDMAGDWSAGHVFYDLVDGPINVASNTPDVVGYYHVTAEVIAAGTGTILILPGTSTINGFPSWTSNKGNKLHLDATAGPGEASAYMPAGGDYGPIRCAVIAHTDVNLVGEISFRYDAWKVA